MEVGAHSQVNTLMNQNLNKPPTELKGNRVILVCIHNVSGTVITHELLYKIFSRFGKVLRILIFDKAQIWKSFVEFSTPEAAVEAKNRVNNMILFSDGSKITIYPSNLDTIKFQKNNSGGVDYTVLDNLNIYGVKEGPPPIQDPRIFNPQEHNYPGYSTLPPPQISQPYQFDPHVAQQNPNIPNQSGILTPTTVPHIEQTQIKNGSSPADISGGTKSTDQSITETKQIEEEKGDVDPADKDFNALVAEVFQTKPTSKAQVTHVHSVPAQLYRDNPLLQQPQSQPQPTLIAESSITGPSVPPGIFPMQNKPIAGGPPLPLNQNAMPMNFIPFSDPSQQQPNFMRGINPMGAPMTQLPQSGSLNNIPLIGAPLQGPMGAQPGQFFPMGQQRPQLNRPFMSQPELPMMGDRMNPMMGQMNVPYFPDPNAKVINPVGMEGGIPQPGMEGFEYASLTNMNRSTLSQLHDNISLLLGKGDENKKSKVLYVKGLEHKDIKVHMLHNIFSNFGNILKIIFIPSKSAALVEFENPDYSTICMDYLNNVVFMTKPLRIFYSKYTIINLKNKKGEDGAVEEVFIGNPKTFRFKKNKNISINPPSSTLHLSNLVKEVCTEETIRTYFTPYGRVEAVKFIFMENNKNMCLVRMSSIEESLNAMAYLHDTEMDGRKVQISFTRSRI